MRIEVIVNMVTGPRREDAFMRAADVFEPFKRLVHVGQDGSPRITVATLTMSREPGADTLEALRKAFEGSDTYPLAIWFEDRPELAWRDETCRVYSTGKTWGLADRWLALLGFPLPAAPTAPAA